jgi:hypothetical protein
MQGKVTMVHNGRFKISYRLFDIAELNVNGPFFKSHIFPSDPHIPYVGQFKPNSTEARVTILLHELGHMVQFGANTYVLPDDGRNSNLSERNTEKVLSVCEKEIKAVVRER